MIELLTENLLPDKVINPKTIYRESVSEYYLGLRTLFLLQKINK